MTNITVTNIGSTRTMKKFSEVKIGECFRMYDDDGVDIRQACFVEHGSPGPNDSPDCVVIWGGGGGADGHIAARAAITVGTDTIPAVGDWDGLQNKDVFVESNLSVLT